MPTSASTNSTPAEVAASNETYVRQIGLAEIAAPEFIALQKAVDVCYTGHKVEDVLKGLASYELQLWRGQSPRGVFVLVTRVIQYPGGRQLEVWSIGGSGYALRESIDAAYRELIQFAKDQQCKWFSVVIERAAFKRLYRRFARFAEYTLMVQEV